MPKVDLNTSLGRISFSYTISTPKETSAEAIDPSLPTILFLHANYFPSETFHPQFNDERLRAGFNLIAMDSRGQGRSHPGVGDTYNQLEAADDVYQFILELKLPPLFIAAIDSGTIMAIQFGVLHPDRLLGLFLVSQLGPEEREEVREGREEIYQAWIEGAQTGDQEAENDSIIGSHQLAYNNKYTNFTAALLGVAVERVTAVWTANPSVSFARTILVDFCALRVPYTIAQLARLKNVPIVIVHGEADVAYPVEYSEDFVNDLKDAGVLNVELKVVEDGPHYLTITHPNELNTWLRTFVLEHSPPAFYNISEPVEAGVFLSPFQEDLVAAGLASGSSPSDDEDDFLPTPQQNAATR